jgi:hypothetical protein
VGKRILVSSPVARFTGLVSNPFAVSLQTLRFHLLVDPHPFEGNSVLPVSAAEYRNPAEIQKHLDKKMLSCYLPRHQGRRSQNSVRIHLPMRRVMSWMMRRFPL